MGQAQQTDQGLTRKAQPIFYKFSDLWVYFLFIVIFTYNPSPKFLHRLVFFPYVHGLYVLPDTFLFLFFKFFYVLGLSFIYHVFHP